MELPPVLTAAFPCRALLVNAVPLELPARLVFQGGLAPKDHLAPLARKELR